MTLESVIEAKKRDDDVQKVALAHERDPYINAAYESLVAARGEDFVRNELGLTPEITANLNPTQQNMELQNTLRLVRNGLVEKVQENYTESADALRGGENGDGVYNIVGVLFNVRPVEYKGVNKDIYKAHERSYEASQDAKNPEKGLQKLIAKYKDDKLVSSTLIFLQRNVKDFSKMLMENRAQIAGDNFYKAMENYENARSYLDGLYEAANSEGKEDIAYGIGKRVAA